MGNLKDKNGEAIFSNDGLWYKITLADGTELGRGDPYEGGDVSAKNGRTHIKVVPAGQGLVFRYQRTDGSDAQDMGWPEGDKGYLRGLQVHPDGTETVMNLSLSWEPVKLCLYNDNNNYGLVARQLPGNRVALYGHNRHGNVCGIRVMPDGTVIGHDSKNAMALDCEFVKVGTTMFKGRF
jgi:hypothetical protein